MYLQQPVAAAVQITPTIQLHNLDSQGGFGVATATCQVEHWIKDTGMSITGKGTHLLLCQLFHVGCIFNALEAKRGRKAEWEGWVPSHDVEPNFSHLSGINIDTRSAKTFHKERSQ